MPRPLTKSPRAGSAKLVWGIILGVGGFVVIASAVLVGIWARGHSPNMGFGEMLTKLDSYYLKPPVYNAIMAIVVIAGLAGVCAVAIGIVLFIMSLVRADKK
jgi:ABC-type Fe3+ transport system permease subunit